MKMLTNTRLDAKPLWRLMPVALVLAAALSFAVGEARGLVSDVAVTYAQGCDGRTVTLTVVATGLVVGEQHVFTVASDTLNVSSPPASPDAEGNATATFSGLASSSPVLASVHRASSSSPEGIVGPFRLLDCSPSVQRDALVGLVQGLNVSTGLANSLNAKLSHIQDALAATRNNSLGVACNSLNAFVNEVAAQAQSQVITAAQALLLTNSALSIKKALGCA
jgi:hypothetical protein